MIGSLCLLRSTSSSMRGDADGCSFRSGSVEVARVPVRGRRVTVAASQPRPAALGRLGRWKSRDERAVEAASPNLPCIRINRRPGFIGHTVVGNTWTPTTPRSRRRGREWRPAGQPRRRQTWTVDRAQHTSDYSEGPNPYLIAHGQPTATAHSATNGVGDPIEASGPDARCTPVACSNPPTVRQPLASASARRDRGGPVDGWRWDLRSDQRRVERRGRARDGQSGEDPEGNLNLRRHPFDRPGSPSTSRRVLSTSHRPDIRSAMSLFPMSNGRLGSGRGVRLDELFRHSRCLLCDVSPIR